MKSFESILSEIDIIENLKNHNNYFAHFQDTNKESLMEHTRLVYYYFIKIISVNSLESIINKLIAKDVRFVFNKDNMKLQNFIKSMFAGAIYFHDFGKINQNFQREKMVNLSFPKFNNGIGSEHSILSAYLYISFFLKKILISSFSEEESHYLKIVLISFSHSIIKHHGELSEVFQISNNQNLISCLNYYFDLFGFVFFEDKESLKDLFDIIEDLKYYKSDYSDTSAMFILLKLNSSLLTASDYLATNEFMNSIKVDNFGTIDESLKDKIINGIENISYNKELLSKFEYYKRLEFDDLDEFSHISLNMLRQKLSAEIISNFRQNSSHKLFYIEAPTGGGKTNLSMLILREILIQRMDINKIFYVFPFTSLITQNIMTFKKDLKLTDNELIQIHSKAPLNNNPTDDFYGNLKKNYIDRLFVNYPFVLLSHIKFFNALVSNGKEDNYILHRLANSIVIIDELQSYTPSEWDKLNFLINEFSEALNITFILMSATLPKISKLISNNENDKFIYLISNKRKYFTNVNFSKRAKFNFDYLDSSNFSFSNEKLAAILRKHSDDYYNKNRKVHSLIEFITKKSAKSFFEYLTRIPNSDFKGYEIIFIDGTILEPRRNEIINYLKTENKGDKIIIIATQVIEAGLDIDMDIGFKDISILDSEEQFAGRINRNATKSDSVVYLFKTGDARFVYGNDLRYKEQKNFDWEHLSQILNSKDFDTYYSHVLNNIDRFNNQDMADNLQVFLSYFKNLNYWKARNSFKLIDSKTISIFVPLEINIANFSKKELDFLNENGVINDLNDVIEGHKVFDLYGKLVDNRFDKKDFLKAKAEIKSLSSIMSKFTFNTYINKTYNYLALFGEELYGFFYLNRYNEIYSYENGLINDLETNSNFI